MMRWAWCNTNPANSHSLLRVGYLDGADDHFSRLELTRFSCFLCIVWNSDSANEGSATLCELASEGLRTMKYQSVRVKASWDLCAKAVRLIHTSLHSSRHGDWL